MNHKFESTYFKTDKNQTKGPQARCHEWGDQNSLSFFVAIDGPSRYEYSSYKDPVRFLEAYMPVPEAERCFFEQIREGQVCNEYYDIDWPLDQAADKSFLNTLEQQVFNAFLNVRNQHAPDFSLSTAHCRVLSASSGKKVSLHIVIPTYVFENNRHMKGFVLALQDTWRAKCPSSDAALLEHIDMGVYSKNRLMRILGSHKFLDPGRPLQRAQWHEPSMNAGDDEFLITNIGPGCVPVTYSTQEVVRAPSTSISHRAHHHDHDHDHDQVIQSSRCMPQQLLDTVEAKFMQTPQASQFKMHCKQDHTMIFKLERKAEGYCAVCEREHTRENAYLRLAESGAIFFHCHRSSSPAGVEVCKPDLALAVEIEVAMALQTPHGPSQADILDDARFLTHLHLAPPLEHLHSGYGKFEIHEQQPPSLLIRCDTGGGKTVFTEALVKANKKSRFLAVTCRRTLADMLEERLDFENYQDIPPSVIACDRLVVQAESLYRLSMKFYCEKTILILDEVSSLIKQMCSDKTMGSMHNMNLQVFERLIRRATRVICLDADLSDEEINIMKDLRSDFIVINNTFQQQKGDNVVLFDSKWALIAEAQSLLQANKRLWISSTMSATRTEAVHAMFTKAGFKGVCVTKNTSETIKRDIGKNINTIMADLDYFIHTPTISVGVDYNVKDHVDYVIGIFSTHSEVDVETCMQMMRRVRQNKSKTYLVHADAAINTLPATAHEVKDWICNQLNLVTGKVRVSPTLKLHLDDDGEPALPDDLYHRMYCHVTANKHRSMNGFRSRLIQRMTQAGCVVIGKSDELPSNHPIIADLKGEEEGAAAALHRQIANAAPIRPDEFEKLSSGAHELSAAQRASVHKFALMRAYDVQEHSIVTGEWVGTFDDAHEKECYKNLIALSPRSGPSLQSCLSAVHQREELQLDYSLRGPTSAEAHSILERSQFTKLEYVVDILAACEFKSPFDTHEVLAEDLKRGVDGIWAVLVSKMSQICTSIKKPRPAHNEWTFKNKLSFLCTVLNEVLGIRIVSVNKRRTKYHLKHCSAVGSASDSPLRAHTPL